MSAVSRPEREAGALRDDVMTAEREPGVSPRARAPGFVHRTLGALLAALVLLSGLALPLSARALDKVTYYHQDALGSTVAATNESGAVIWRERYLPYGTRVRREDGGANSLWYTGKPEETQFGLQYFGARWYDPQIGQFMAADPVAFSDTNPMSFNRYIYANGNPFKYVDPDGEFPLPIIALAMVGAVTGGYAGWAGSAAVGGDGQSQAVAAGFGAIFGGIMGVFNPGAAVIGGEFAPIAGAMITNAVTGSVSNVASQYGESASQGKNFSGEFSPGSVLSSALAGGLSGPLAATRPVAAMGVAATAEPIFEKARSGFAESFIPQLPRSPGTSETNE